jgi:hypothetical protein
MCVPLEREFAVDRSHSSTAKEAKEKVSPGLLEEFRRRNLRNVSERDIEVFGRTLSNRDMEMIRPDWRPENYREDIIHSQEVPGEDGPDEGSWLMTTAAFFSRYKPSA